MDWRSKLIISKHIVPIIDWPSCESKRGLRYWITTRTHSFFLSSNQVASDSIFMQANQISI